MGGWLGLGLAKVLEEERFYGGMNTTTGLMVQIMY